MHQRNLRLEWLSLGFSLTTLFCWAQPPAFVEIREPNASQTARLESGDTERTSVLRKGLELESRRSFGEALVHYEDAVRQFPNDRELSRRLEVVRIRFDLVRRYADRSFVSSSRRLSTGDAIHLFDEVCNKITTHYVESPDWKALVTRGNRNLEIALRDNDFLEVNSIQATTQDLDRFVRWAFRMTQSSQVDDVLAARDLVLKLANAGQSSLGIPSVVVILEYVCGATTGLDEYSTFLTPEQLDDVFSQIQGNFVGLGIELKSRSSGLLITNVIDGGPASRSGIRPGDEIVEVNGKSMMEISTEKAADMLKGEEGSSVQIVISDEQGVARRLRVSRERVEVPSVEDVRMLDQEAGIAYFKLSSFQKTTSRDVDTALWKLHRQGMRSLIVDLRGNPGGLLTESVEIADKFVMDGTIVSTRGRSSNEDYDYKAHRVGTWRVSLVVLIDGDSASASEIFAGAIRDHRRGTIVGKRSYGKGSVQGIFPLRTAQTGVRLTTAKFYSPSGQPISKLGVEPDVLVRAEGGESRKEGPDATLKAGIEAARQLVARRRRYNG